MSHVIVARNKKMDNIRLSSFINRFQCIFFQKFYAVGHHHIIINKTLFFLYQSSNKFLNKVHKQIVYRLSRITTDYLQIDN